MSSTVTKALTILNHFSEAEPEIGLSDLARRAGLDKATVHRMLVVMSEAGLIEQSGDSRQYRLGAGVLRLARVRESSFPVTAVYQAALDRLTSETGETSHASLVAGRALATIAISESSRSIRVSLVAGEILPFHSTASGLAVLAFSDQKLQKRILEAKLNKKTAKTIISTSRLKKHLQAVLEQGYAVGDQTNEDDVYGIAAPVFNHLGYACGAVAVAAPAHRMTEDLRLTTIKAVLNESRSVTAETGGLVPDSE